MKQTFIDNLEKQEIIKRLTEKGFGDLVEALLMREAEVYTKKGRLNKSGACRILGWKPKDLEDALKECKQILGPLFED
jgi:nucleoside-diphosphate-sugar epimerase